MIEEVVERRRQKRIKAAEAERAKEDSLVDEYAGLLVQFARGEQVDQDRIHELCDLLGMEDTDLELDLEASKAAVAIEAKAEEQRICMEIAKGLMDDCRAAHEHHLQLQAKQQSAAARGSMLGGDIRSLTRKALERSHLFRSGTGRSIELRNGETVCPPLSPTKNPPKKKRRKPKAEA